MYEGWRGDILAIEEEASAIRRHFAGDEVDERGLARAVRPDQADDLPLADGHVGRVHRGDAAKPLGNRPGFEDGRHYGVARARQRPTMPSGTSVIATISKTP